VDEKVNRDKTGEADEMNLGVHTLVKLSSNKQSKIRNNDTQLQTQQNIKIKTLQIHLLVMKNTV